MYIVLLLYKQTRSSRPSLPLAKGNHHARVVGVEHANTIIAIAEYYYCTSGERAYCVAFRWTQALFVTLL